MRGPSGGVSGFARAFGALRAAAARPAIGAGLNQRWLREGSGGATKKAAFWLNVKSSGGIFGSSGGFSETAIMAMVEISGFCL